MVTEFHLKQAAFVEILEKTNFSNDTDNYADRYNMFMTTYNPGEGEIDREMIKFYREIDFSSFQMPSTSTILFTKFRLLANC